MLYYIYIIRCEDNKLYTGITTDYKRRFLEHKSGIKGAKFTKAFKPKKIEVLYKTDSRSNALKLENKIKKLPKIKKRGSEFFRNQSKSNLKNNNYCYILEKNNEKINSKKKDDVFINDIV